MMHLSLLTRTASAPLGTFAGQRNNRQAQYSLLHDGSEHDSEFTKNTADTTREETSSSSSSSSSSTSPNLDRYEPLKKQHATKHSLRLLVKRMLPKRKNTCSTGSLKRNLEAAVAAEILGAEMDEDDFMIAFLDDDEPSVLSTSTELSTVIVSNTSNESKKKSIKCHDGNDAIKERTLREAPREPINVIQQEPSRQSPSILDDQEQNEAPTTKQLSLWRRAKQNFKESRNDIVLDQPLLPTVPRPGNGESMHRNNTGSSYSTATATPVTPICYALPNLSELKDTVKRNESYSDCMSTEAKELLAPLKAHDDSESLTILLQQTFVTDPSFAFETCDKHYLAQLMDNMAYDKPAAQQLTNDSDGFVNDRITI